MTTKLSKTDKLFNILNNGENVPIRTLERRTGLVNISAAVDRLRNEGFTIYMNKKTNSRGQLVNNYRMVPVA